jgi:subtilisin family serine protease
MKRLRFVAGLALLLSACHDGPTVPEATPILSRSTVRGTGSYIVRLRDDVQNAASVTDRLVTAHAGQLKFRYHYMKGFAAQFSERDSAALARDPDVVSVSTDGIIHVATTQPNPPSWGLDRVDQAYLPMNNAYTYTNTGTGVTVFILDSGIWLTHADFSGRALTGEDEITPGGSAGDCNGHGTHVAGTVGGADYGVAKNVNLVSVRVTDCSGTGNESTVLSTFSP